jgi:hypothetical protein
LALAGEAYPLKYEKKLREESRFRDEVDQPGIAGLDYGSEVRSIADVSIRTQKLIVIEDAEKLRPELEGRTLGHGRFLN